MSEPDRPVSPPVENTTPSNAGMATEAWIIKGLNDLREDVKGIRESVSGVDKRLLSLEKTVMRFAYSAAGAVAVLALIWTIFQVATRYFDIEVKPKATSTQQQP